MRDSLTSWQTFPGRRSPGKLGGLGLGWPQTPVSHHSLLCFPGGADKNVIVFDKSSEQILATLKGHSKKVTSVVFHPSQDLVFSASPDATIRIWSVPNASCVQVVRAHEGSVTGLSLHATGDYLLSSSDDQVRPSPGPQTPPHFSSRSLLNALFLSSSTGLSRISRQAVSSPR